METRRLVTTVGMAAGFAMAAFSGAGVDQARADDDVYCWDGGCNGETCASTKPCNAAGPPFTSMTTCGTWMGWHGIECGPKVNWAVYGGNGACLTSPRRNSSSPLIDQTNAINAVTPVWEPAGLTIRYTIPWPSPSQDPCFGTAKTMELEYTCGLRTTTSFYSAEAANKTVAISCPQ